VPPGVYRNTGYKNVEQWALFSLEIDSDRRNVFASI
jgi:hypothetical protein